jgi:hypothetical protein
MNRDFRIEVRLRRPLVLDCRLDVSVALIAAIDARLGMVIRLQPGLHVLVHSVAGMRG